MSGAPFVVATMARRGLLVPGAPVNLIIENVRPIHTKSDQNYDLGIFAQDRPILESQRPELLPLDLTAELSIRADRAAIAYRRWLKRLGVSFGTA